MLNRLDFDWPYLSIALGGVAGIDLRRLSIETKADAKRFLLSYGFDVDDPFIKEEIWRVYFQSISFIKNHLLEQDEEIPEEMLSRGGGSDILKLLLEASENTKGHRSQKSAWSCAILRVMHVILHLDYDIRLENFQFARTQIFERFDNALKINGRYWKIGEGKRAINVLRYIKKERKERSSTILKLLAKPRATAHEIYDRLGVRFVTESRFDAFRLLNAFIEEGVVSPVNIFADRTINSLIPHETFKETIQQAFKDLSDGKISLKESKQIVKSFDEELWSTLEKAKNPNTSMWYRAVQMTCRQLIIAPDPAFTFWSNVKKELRENSVTEEIIQKIPVTVREKRRFYYPFEIQVMDKESYKESIGGRSRHREYKAKQRLMARNRVLRDLVC